MKHILITTIAAVLVVGCGPSVDIHQAVIDGNIEVVKQHIADGADVDTKLDRGYTALHYAAHEGHKEIAELLISEGADVDAKDDKFGTTPLSEAADGGHMEVAELLIAKGADVNAKNKDGWLPLDAPVINDHTEIADLLRKHVGKTGEELKAEGK